MLDTIRNAWGWIGLEPSQVIATNKFGNLVVRATDGSYWRICPEELSCQQITHSEPEFDALWTNEEFQRDWEMESLVELAVAKLGALPEGQCYYLVRPSVLGGSYDATNLETITLNELISVSGHIAEQIKDVPDGGQIQFEII